MVSVVVPCKHNTGQLVNLVIEITKGSLKPSEIIVTCAHAQVAREASFELSKIVSNIGIAVRVEFKPNALPGEARNHGIKLARCDVIAMLDVRTIPPANWLRDSLTALNANPDLAIVWGRFKVKTNSFLTELLADGIFGRVPKICLPGTVVRKSVLTEYGLMVEGVVAGEDREWMSRVNHLPSLPLIEPVTYLGLIDQGLGNCIKKWWRYYSQPNADPMLATQKTGLLLAFFALVLVIIFNWNYGLAYYFSVPIFVPHITKIYIGLVFLGALVYRGVLRPVALGVPLDNLLPVRFLFIAGICSILDATKFFAFIQAKITAPLQKE